MENKPKIRLFVKSQFDEGAALVLNQPQSHYLLHVMRIVVGQQILVFNGSQGEWLAEVSKADKKQSQLQLQRQVRQQTGAPDIWLLFTPVKNKTEIIIEKAVELGATRIVPILTRYCVVRSLNEDRLRARIIEAAEQCGRLDIPLLEPLQQMQDVLSNWQNDRLLFFADERGDGTSLKKLLAEDLPQSKAIVIGPEGGFSPEEQQALLGCSFVRSCCLGPRILRADTAAIAALSCVMAWHGDWQEQPCYPQLAAGSTT